MKRSLLCIVTILVSLSSDVDPLADLEVTLWAEQPMLQNPIAISHDPQGRIYVTETARRDSADLDLRRMPGLEPVPWPVLDATLQSFEDKRDAIKRNLAPGSSDNNLWLIDRNGDGSRDWRDLTTISEKIHRLEDTDGDGQADQYQTFADDFQTEFTGMLAGVLWHPNGVYATVVPDLWLLRDEDHDGRADTKASLVTGLGVHIGWSGHDMHGLIVGPDGKIYWSIGDKGISLTTKEGRRLHYPNQGLILRANPDGSELEVFAGGLRNCQEPAFDEYGNWFCVDNDGDFKGERERFLYVTEGSDFGWRSNWQFNLTNEWADSQGLPEYNPWMEERLFVPQFEGQAAYITPPLSNYSDGPCGFVYNPGTALNEEYQRYFFLTQFPGKLSAFQVRPNGAGFEMVNDRVLYRGFWGTGLSFGPDGALYMADWGNTGWRLNDSGAIHRFDVNDTHNNPIRLETEQLIRAGMRHRSNEAVIELLGHPDQRVRLQAQFELVAREQGSTLVEVAFDRSAHQLARIHGLWGMGQLVRAGQLSLNRDLSVLLADSDPEIRAQTAQFIAAAKPGDAEVLLRPLLKDARAPVQFHAAMALAKVGTSNAIGDIVDLLAKNDKRDPFIRHASVMALVGIGQAEPILELSAHPSPSVRLAAVVALRRLQHPGVVQFLSDNNEHVILEAARAIHDDASIPEGMAALASLIHTTTLSDEALLRRVINANLRLGTHENAESILAFALDEEQPEAMQLEALQALTTWNAPPFLDRVDRRYRRELQQRRFDITPLLAARRSGLIASDSVALQEASLELLRNHRIDVGGEHRGAWLTDTSRPLTFRLEAFRSVLEDGKPAEQVDAMDAVFSSSDEQLRVGGLALLTEVDPEQALDRIRVVLDEAMSMREQQQALRSLGKLKQDTAVALLNAWLFRLADHKVRASIQLDVYEAARENGASELLMTLGAIEVADHAADPVTRFRYALEGGNAERGRQLFESHLTAQCVTCHRVGGEGSTVGPDIKGIGSRADREYMLQSLVDPGAYIAPGHTTTVMPEMGDLLSLGEMRDLVAYLAGLKEFQAW